MATPATVASAGVFRATRAGAPAGEAVLHMRTKTKGTLALGGSLWNLTGNATTKRFKGKAGAKSLELKIVNRSSLTGTVEGDTLELTRAVLRPITATEMAQADPGPTGAMKTFMDSTPDYEAQVGDSTTFWYEFGPVLYRGRLDGSARLMGIASDPGPVECLPFMRRTLVGDSGQKTQGFLAKLGLIRSYVLVNAFAVALKPGQVATGRKLLVNNAVLAAARHGLYNRLLAGGALEAIVAFGENAHRAYDLWVATNPAAAALPVLKVAHPAAVDRTGSGADAPLKGWAKAVTQLRGLVTPDTGGDPSGPNYGAYFTENDYTRIPRWDLPSMAPAYAGDDSWGRASTPRHNNCANRPRPDDFVSLLLTPAPGQGSFLKYRYQNGQLVKTKNQSGTTVATDVFGIPT